MMMDNEESCALGRMLFAWAPLLQQDLASNRRANNYRARTLTPANLSTGCKIMQIVEPHRAPLSKTKWTDTRRQLACALNSAN